jgi:hypothetical protein
LPVPNADGGADKPYLVFVWVKTNEVGGGSPGHLSKMTSRRYPRGD